MKKTVLITLLLLLPFAAQAQKTADDVARRAIETAAGEAWAKARYFSFTFNVEREGKNVASFAQKWDRVTGDYRVSGKDPQGLPFDVVVNLKTKKGRANRNGIDVTDPAVLADNLSTIAMRRFSSDTFWLLMPLRMMDATQRSLEGERTDSCGRAWDVVKLTFDPAVGLTPGDTYWAWVNRDTGLVDEWDMRQQARSGDQPTEILFRDYRRVAGLLISTRREIRGKNQTVRLDNLEILLEPPKGAFQ